MCDTIAKKFNIMKFLIYSPCITISKDLFDISDTILMKTARCRNPILHVWACGCAAQVIYLI
jgi:hypothetical protein